MYRILSFLVIFILTVFGNSYYNDLYNYEKPVAEASEPDVNNVTFSGTLYELNVQESLLSVLVQSDRSAMVEGHDRGIRAMDFTSTLKWHPEDPSKCKVEITVPVKMLDVDPPGLRQRLNLEGETSDNDKKKIKKNMFGKSQLNAESFPIITYKSIFISGTSGKVEITGDLTIRGITKRITTILDIQQNSETLRAKGSFSIQHTDFAFKPFSALMGLIRNDNKLTFYIDIIAHSVSHTPMP